MISRQKLLRVRKQLTARKRKYYLRDNPEFALLLAWKRGLLKYKLFDYQHDLFDIFENADAIKTVVNSSRRWGKTTIALLYALIFGISRPNSQIKIATKTQKSLKKTITPIFKMLIADCPESLKPVFSSKDECWNFPNGSQLHMHGTDNQRHDSLRGQLLHLGIVDEAAFCSDLRYIVQSILLPQTLTCGGKIILLSTPDQFASQSGAEFKAFCDEAKFNDAYFEKDIYTNTSLTPEKIEEYKKETGGEDSIEWQVEYLIKWIVDPEKAIVREWRTDKMLLPEKFVPEDNPFFKFYHRYTCLDLGVKRDWTVGLCGYYDFQDATLIILKEFFVKNTTTPEIADLLKTSEIEAFGPLPIYRRVCDSDNPQLVNDFVHLHHIGISATNKTTLEAMVNGMRMMVGEGRVKVHPSCTLLIATLESGVWSNSEAGQLHKDFGRTKVLGHCDAIAALMYMIRNLNTTSNPVPTTYGVNIANSLISNHNNESHNKKQFSKAFVTPAKRNRSR